MWATSPVAVLRGNVSSTTSLSSSEITQGQTKRYDVCCLGCLLVEGMYIQSSGNMEDKDMKICYCIAAKVKDIMSHHSGG